MIKKLIYNCLLTVTLACTCVVGLLSCEDEDEFETLVGNWYCRKIRYFCFRDDGTGFVQEFDYRIGEERYRQRNFVYKYDPPLDSLVFLQFKNGSFRDTLRLEPIEVNEVVIDGFTYLRVKNEPELLRKSNDDCHE